jgi:dolichyl-phosphate-mannose--protein O-mannosyl transferase
MTVVIELAGWAGALAVLFAYGLVSAERVSSRSWSYQLLNIGGAIGLVINSSWNGAIPSAVVNLIWIGIGVYALVAGRLAVRAQDGPR